MLLLIDNYDSFSHNLERYFVELGQDVDIVRNDQIDLAGIEALKPDHLVISPGPCTPNEAGISLAVVNHFAGNIPILGVCLGHQVIGQAFAAKVTHAKEIKHGKTSAVYHQGKGLFGGIPSPFNATRYHSLVLEKDSIPIDFEVTAWSTTQNGDPEIMAIAHRQLALYGVQFHPESFLTESGHTLLNNFLKITK